MVWCTSTAYPYTGGTCDLPSVAPCYYEIPNLINMMPWSLGVSINLETTELNTSDSATHVSNLHVI